MNNLEAKNIPLSLYVEHIGGRYSHTDRKREIWYFSPFRPDEHTASFKINEQQTHWHDFGLSSGVSFNKRGEKQSSGGDIADLWCDWNGKDRRLGNKEALQALAAFIGKNAIRVVHLQRQPRKEKPVVQNEQPRFKILKISDRIKYIGLTDELHRRRISVKVAEYYLKQGYILDTVTDKKYNAFLFENDKGGFEVSIPNPHKQECFKTCIGPKASTRLLQADTVNSADVFEGFWDFLTWLEFNKLIVPKNHTYVLNSTSLVEEVCERMIHFKENVVYAFLFMDNDEAGYQATHAIAKNLEEHDIKVGSWEQFYRGYKDLSAFWMNNNYSP